MRKHHELRQTKLMSTRRTPRSSERVAGRPRGRATIINGPMLTGRGSYLANAGENHLRQRSITTSSLS
ncbi:MAG: hypothetical protein DMG04_06830 [Acidobacteria bacterium]|nr:MAG: hypothetical protein DMG04_06830 [Acidobacteriota bacterium]PYR12501.1 MAG: hypothetical protein DMF99_04190 [Acidobacteriota bacterium]